MTRSVAPFMKVEVLLELSHCYLVFSEEKKSKSREWEWEGKRKRERAREDELEGEWQYCECDPVQTLRNISQQWGWTRRPRRPCPDTSTSWGYWGCGEWVQEESFQTYCLAQQSLQHNKHMFGNYFLTEDKLLFWKLDVSALWWRQHLKPATISALIKSISEIATSDYLQSTRTRIFRAKGGEGGNILTAAAAAAPPPPQWRRTSSRWQVLRQEKLIIRSSFKQAIFCCSLHHFYDRSWSMNPQLAFTKSD